MRAVATRASPGERAEAGERAAGHLSGLSAYQEAGVLALYAATPRELDTAAVFRQARAAGKRCVFPRCVGARSLEFAEVSDLQELKGGRYGILEPQQGLPVLEPLGGDLVLVPGVAFDRAGRRVGRGAGYYDRAFSSPGHGPLLVGFTYSDRIVEAVPTEPHDRRLDAIVTEAGVAFESGS